MQLGRQPELATCVFGEMPDWAMLPIQIDFMLPDTSTAPQLTGTLPDSLGALTALRRLALSRHKLSVQFFSFFFHGNPFFPPPPPTHRPDSSLCLTLESVAVALPPEAATAYEEERPPTAERRTAPIAARRSWGSRP